MKGQGLYQSPTPRKEDIQAHRSRDLWLSKQAEPDEKRILTNLRLAF